MYRGVSRKSVCVCAFYKKMTKDQSLCFFKKNEKEENINDRIKILFFTKSFFFCVHYTNICQIYRIHIIIKDFIMLIYKKMIYLI